jgi:hypothetical protein
MPPQPNPHPLDRVLSKLVGHLCDLVDRAVERHARRKPPQAVALDGEDTAELVVSEEYRPAI